MAPIPVTTKQCHWRLANVMILLKHYSRDIN
jgi:hypothetical protein